MLSLVGLPLTLASTIPPTSLLLVFCALLEEWGSSALVKPQRSVRSSVGGRLVLKVP